MLANMKLALLALLFAVTVHAQWTARIEGAFCREGGGCLNDCDAIEKILHREVLPRAEAKGLVLCQRWADYARVVFLMSGRHGDCKWNQIATDDPELRRETGGQIVNACSVSDLCGPAFREYKFRDAALMPATFYCVKGYLN
ncbi:hypothetical protein BGZ67_004147 [Mortierella alpina]|nr:hypothetical protein BGZ67_004147 [Mortierella alpina]